MIKVEDFIGKRFGKLVVQEYSHIYKKQRMWLCQCDCGGKTYATTNALNRGHKTSCGCKHKEKNIKHGLYHTKLYDVYTRMLSGCRDKNTPRYSYIGAKGITVCDEWLNKENGLQNFYNWAIKNGYKEGKDNTKNNTIQLARKDITQNYSPQNCCWVTVAQRNLMINTHKRYVTLNGITKTLSEWARENGLSYFTVKQRIDNYGWSIEDAIFTKKQQKKRKLH